MVIKGKIYTKECKARELPEDQFAYKYMRYITGDKLERTVMYVSLDTKISKKAGIEGCKLLNRNLVFKQLDIPIPYTDKRGIFYYVLDELNGKIDLKGVSEQRKFTNMELGVIDYFIKKLHNTMYAKDPKKYSYWGFTQDYIEVRSKPTTGFYFPKINPETNKLERHLLTEENIIKALNVPFYLLVGEKISVIEPVGYEMVKRGYNIGYYIMDLGGNAKTEAIKILRKLSRFKNVHVLVLHDGDLDGFQILFDLTKHIKAISVGINPEFLEYCNIKIKDVKVEYSSDKQHEQSYEGTNKTLSKIKDKIDTELYQKFELWTDFSYHNKIELNSVIKRREEEDMYSCLVKDFCDYIEYIIPQQKWNLLRHTNFKPIDEISFKESEKRIRSDGTFYQRIPLNYTTISYTNEPKLRKVYTYIPEIDDDTEEALEKNITKDDSGFGKIYQDIITVLDSYKSKINSKLLNKETMIKRELDDKYDILYKSIIDENPELFDVDWEDLKDIEKISQFNKIVVLREKYLALQTTLKYMKYKKALKNYKGSIKEPRKPVQDKQIKLAKFYDKRKKLHNKKIANYNLIIENDLKEKEEYKTAKDIAENLQEYTEVISIDTNDVIEKLKQLKEQIEQGFKTWYIELKEILEVDKNNG